MNSAYYWPAKWASVVLLAGVCRCLSSIVVVCKAAGGRAGRPPYAGGRHCTAGQYGYVPLGRHLVCLDSFAGLGLGTADLDYTTKLVIGRRVNRRMRQPRGRDSAVVRRVFGRGSAERDVKLCTVERQRTQLRRQAALAVGKLCVALCAVN